VKNGLKKIQAAAYNGARTVYWHKNSKINKKSNFFDDFWCRKYFLKKTLLGVTTTDFFEPIFGFLGQFCFEKYSSVSWNRIGMFSELSGHSDT
jgi:hypothetical protein